MIGWFVRWLQGLVQLAIDLAVGLVGGLLSAPFTAARRAGSEVAVRRGRTDEVIDVRHRVLRAGMPRDSARFAGDDDPETRHWVAVQADRVVGVVTVIRTPFPSSTDSVDGVPGTGEPTWQLRGMAILPELQGEHLGERLLSATHADVAEPMWCNARQAVVGFYRKYGWTAIGEPFDQPPIGVHQRMIYRP